MDVDIHDRIAFYTCELARRRNPNLVSDPQRKVLDAARSSAMMRTTLAQLWTHASEKLLEQMANTYHVEASSVADARGRVGKAASLDGFGAYSASGHLDILDSSDEFAKKEEQYFPTHGKQLVRRFFFVGHLATTSGGRPAVSSHLSTECDFALCGT